jgi:hypothetical protein
MRNKITLLIGLLVLAFTVNAQKADRPIGDLDKKIWTPAKEIVKQHNTHASKAVIYSEDFSSGALPTGWSNVDNTANGFVWEFNNPGARDFFSTTNANGFVIFDSDNYGGGDEAENNDLISDTIDCSANSFVVLSFEHYFRSGYGGSGAVLVTGDNGTTWDTIAQYGAESTANAEAASFNITDIAAGQSQVIVKFHWEGDYSWYWAIDDFAIIEPTDDFAVAELILPALVFENDAITLTAVIENKASTEQSKTVSFKVDDVEVGTATTATLAFGDVDTVSFEWTPTTAANYAIAAEVPADENTDNDVLEANLVVASSTQLAEDFEGDFLPLGWAQNESGWIQTGASLSGENAAFIVHSVGAPEEMLVTRPVILDGSITTLSYWTNGLNNVYGFGSSTLQLKYKEVGGTTWTDLGAADDYAVSGDGARWVEVDLSAIPNGNYYFAFAATTTFDYTGYNSGVRIDAVVGPELMTLQTVTFNAVDEAAAALENVNIDITGDAFAVGGISIATDETGVATAGLVDGNYDYTASLFGYIDSVGTVTVAGADETVDLIMEAIPGNEVTFTVVDGDAAPVEGANIYVVGELLTTDASGIATLEIIDGKFAWVAYKSGYHDAMDSVEVSGAPVAVDITLEMMPEGAIIFEDDFESYNVGDLIAANSVIWETWAGSAGGGPDDTPVSDVQANSGTQSMWVESVDGAADMVLKLGNKTTGLYTVGWWMYVPDGYEGYYNFQEDEEPGVSWAFDVYFLDDETGHLDIDGVSYNFTYTQDSWVYVEQYFDLDNDYASLKVGDMFVHGWEYTAPLGGIDIFAGDGVDYYLDDIFVRNHTFAGGTVTFNVVDENAAAFEGVEVDINGLTLTTDAAGMVELLLDNGEYPYTVSALGYVVVEGSVTIADANESIDIAMVQQWAATFNLDVNHWGELNTETDFIWLSGATADETGGIAGFNPWQPANSSVDLKLLDEDEDGIYTVTIPYINPGNYIYRYKVTQGIPVVVNEWPLVGEPNLTFEIVDADITVNDIANAINETNTLTTFSVYPNPTKGVVTISTENTCEVTVSNAIGQVIVNRVVSNNETLDLSNQTQGLYFITAKTDAETKTMRLIIE